MKFESKNITYHYLQDICRRKILFLITVAFFAAIMTTAYQYYFAEFTVKASYFFQMNASNKLFSENTTDTFPGIQLSKWQLISKSIPTYNEKLLKSTKLNTADLDETFYNSSFINNIQPILTYSKSDVRDFSQLTAQRVLEKNNVIGFTIKTTARSKDEAVKLNLNLKKKLSSISESYIIEEILLSLAPWLWNSKYLDSQIILSLNKIKKINADINFLDKVISQRPELMKFSASVIIQNPIIDFSYLPFSTQLSSKIYELEMSRRNHVSLLESQSQYTEISKILFGNYYPNNAYPFTQEMLAYAIEKTQNSILIDAMNKIENEIIFFKYLEFVPSSLKVETSFEFIYIFFSVIFALITTVAFFILIDKNNYLENK